MEKLKHSQRFQALPDVDKVHMLLHARVSTSRGRCCALRCCGALCRAGWPLAVAMARLL